MVTRRLAGAGPVVRAVLVGIAALAAGPAVAQQVYQDEYGVWRYLVPPPVDGPEPLPPPRGVWRSAPPVEAPGWRVVRPGRNVEEILRRRVPDYDRDGWSEEAARPAVPDPYEPDAYERDLATESGDWRSVEPTFPSRSQARVRPGEITGPVVRSAPETPDWSAGGQANLPAAEAPRGGHDSADLADKIARYAAAKRMALETKDPTARLSGVREANAYLVSIARGAASPDAIRAIDTLMGMKVVTKDTTQLPGAGTELKTPIFKPTAAEREAAEKVADYIDLRGEGEAPTSARDYLPESAGSLDDQALADLDAFLGLDADTTAATR